jgi:ABC-type bacteriocin/lantibiotic exporter with double-glycine peptidase domain
VQALLGNLVPKYKSLAEQLSSSETKLWEVKADITNNIEQINLRDGEAFVKNKYNTLSAKKNDIEKKYEYYENIKTSVGKFTAPFDRIIDIAYFTTNIINNEIAISQIPLIKYSIDDVYSFLSSNINFHINSNELMIAKERIDQLFEIISAATDNDLIRTENSEHKVIFKNYVIKLDGQDIVKINNFEFIAAKHYAITGKSGCGKTSTLIDLKAGLAGALSSTGEISIAKDDKIMFIDQKLYLPREATLLESIYFPNILQKLSSEQLLEIKNRVIALFKDLAIDQFVDDSDQERGLVARLDNKEFKLSGGQAKKIAII